LKPFINRFEFLRRGMVLTLPHACFDFERDFDELFLSLLRPSRDPIENCFYLILVMERLYHIGSRACYPEHRHASCFEMFISRGVHGEDRSCGAVL